MRRVPFTDFLLWAVLAVSFGGTRLAVQQWNVTRQNHNPLVHRYLDWADRGFDDFDFTLIFLGIETAIYLIPVAAVAWVVQAAVVACGARLAGRHRPAHAADYDDKLRPRRG
jgi:hypothetical protein